MVQELLMYLYSDVYAGMYLHYFIILNLHIYIPALASVAELLCFFNGYGPSYLKKKESNPAEWIMNGMLVLCIE